MLYILWHTPASVKKIFPALQLKIFLQKTSEPWMPEEFSFVELTKDIPKMHFPFLLWNGRRGRKLR